jgi:hypothetical protein
LDLGSNSNLSYRREPYLPERSFRASRKTLGPWISLRLRTSRSSGGALQGNDATPRVFAMPREDAELLDFAANDINKRVTALRDALT